jgi:small subunit ribosomal protein S15
MYLTTEKKQEIFKTNGIAKSTKDTGSAESQIGLFTFRINHLTSHLQKNPKDFSTRLGLLKLVGKRRRLLDYLNHIDINRYRAIIGELNIRK